MAPQINVKDLLAYGEEQLGKPYVFGAAGPDTFDCSGLISYMYKHYGVALPHHAADQARLGTAVAPGAIGAGDLVFSDWGDGPNSHVGIATDSGHILNAPQPGENVKISTLTPSYRKRITAVRRVGDLVDTPVTTQPGGVPTTTGQTVPSNTTGFQFTPTPGSPTSPTSPTPTGGPSGGDGGGSSNVLESAWNGLLSLGSDAGQLFTGPFREVAKPLQDIGSAAIEGASIADKIFSLFLPSNFLRLVAGTSGVVLILFGLMFLKHEMQG